MSTACAPATWSPSASKDDVGTKPWSSWPRPSPTTRARCAMPWPVGSRSPSACPWPRSSSSSRAPCPRLPRASSSAPSPERGTWPRNSSPPDLSLLLTFSRLPRRSEQKRVSAGRGGEPGRPTALVPFDLVLVAEGEADVVEAFEEAPAGEVVEVEAGLDAAVGGAQRAGLDVDHDLQVGVVDQGVDQGARDICVDLHRQGPDLGAVGAEDVGEARGDHSLEAVVLQGPHGVFARRPGTEVGSGHENGGALVAVAVEDETGVVAPLREQAPAEPSALHPLEPVPRDDLVGIAVGSVERHPGALDDADGFHHGPVGVLQRPRTP